MMKRTSIRRFSRIFLLFFQDAFQHRSRSLVYLLLSIIGPFLMMLFWRGVHPAKDWTYSLITSYYIYIILAGAFLMTHIEEDVARIDIQEGNLTTYLLRPFSYFWIKFIDSFSYRVIQGFFGILVLLFFFFFYPDVLTLSHSLSILLLSVLISLLALFLTFTFKMIIGISAFWLIEIHGIFEITEVVLAVFAGFLMPIVLLPEWLFHVASLLPFSYMIYYPIVAFEGKLTIHELLQTLVIQFVWLVLFYIFYQVLWKAGIRKFSAVGR